MVVIRHAAARPRPDWPASDPDRPLDEHGVRDAARLADLLSVWAPRRILTSPSVRCIETIKPYAARAAATIELVPLLSEEGYAQDPAALAAYVSDLLAALRLALQHGDDGGVAICTHRPLLVPLAAAMSIPVPPRDAEEPLPPGGCWVVHLALDASSTVERHPAPR